MNLKESVLVELSVFSLVSVSNVALRSGARFPEGVA